MFSVRQKQKISEEVQRVLRETNHPELPKREIQFSLHVHGRFQWSWADIKNNGAVFVPSVNPWNEAQDKGTPAESRYGREPWENIKPLAQYFDEYIEHEIEIGNIDVSTVALEYTYNSWRELLEQALDAYQSTENVTIKIERV